MFPKIILFGGEGRAKMLEGINILANSVKSTLGPRGRNVLIANKNMDIRFTKDGVSVAKEVCREDAVEETGINVIKAVSLKTCDTVGDGTTTATVIAQNIINQGIGFINDGSNPIDLKHGIDTAINLVENYIASKSINVSTDEEIINVATIACNGDREIGEIIADTFKKVGKDGVITLEQSSNGKTESTIVEGLQIDSGFISPYFVTNPSKMICELENPYILFHDRKISTLQPMMPLMESIVRANESLVIIAEDVDSEALATLVINHRKNGYKIVAIQNPSLGNHKIGIINDLEVMTGAKVASEDTGIKLENMRKDMLGRAKKITISAHKTTFIGGYGNPEQIKERCAYLENEIESCEQPAIKYQLQERLAKLTNGIAVIKVGGVADFDIKEKKDRVEDAIHATRSALKDGILPGGGIALLNASEYLNNFDISSVKQGENSQAFINGLFLIETALKSPWNQILENAGLIPEEIYEFLPKDKFTMGYDALKNEYVDMVEAGIIDPTKVVITAFKDAASIAGILLTTDVVLIEENEITLNTVDGPSNSIRVRV